MTAQLNRRQTMWGLLAAASVSMTNAVFAAARELVATLPGKVGLRRLTHRPPNYETPIEYFRSTLTPNEAFFVATT